MPGQAGKVGGGIDGEKSVGWRETCMAKDSVAEFINYGAGMASRLVRG